MPANVMPLPLPAPDAELAPVTEAEFPLLRQLAGRIWRECYEGIVSAEQISFMLGRRFSDSALHETLRNPDHRLELLRVGGEPVGYCASQSLPEEPGTLKLGQLYLLDSWRGRGLGRFMLGQVEARARALGRRAIVLQVNKGNARAIAFYHASGFTVREAAVFEIGGGYVMDDFVMERRLGEPPDPGPG